MNASYGGTDLSVDLQHISNSVFVGQIKQLVTYYFKCGTSRSFGQRQGHGKLTNIILGSKFVKRNSWDRQAISGSLKPNFETNPSHLVILKFVGKHYHEKNNALNK